MAIQGITVTLGNAIGSGQYSTTGANVTDPVAALATVKTDSTAIVTAAAPVAAALAVLVADGASPTQAHVTTLNTAYTTLAAAITASNTATQAFSLSANFTMLLDLTVMTSLNAVKSAVAQALQILQGSGTVASK